jgi:outer membrane protein TolC
MIYSKLSISLSFLLSAAVNFNVNAGALTEQDAVIAALSSNPSIEISRIKDTSSALGLAVSEAAWLPQVDLTSTSSVAPKTNVALTANDKAAVTQALPGGGTVGASAAYSGTHLTNPASSSDAGIYSVDVTQPLLKDAWAYGNPGYSIKLARLDRQQFSLQQKKDLASDISSIRAAYWNCYEAKTQLGIAQNALAYASDALNRERIRFTVGNSAPVDTLSAYLEKLKAQQALIDNEAAFDKSLNELSRALRTEKTAIQMPDSTEISVNDLPEPDVFINQVEQYDPQLRIFEVLKAKLELQLRKSRNALLPSASLQASYLYNTQTGDASLAENSVYSLVLGYSLPTKTARIARTQAALSLRTNTIEQADYRRDLRNRLEEMVNSWKREQEKLAIARIARDVSQKYLDAATKGHELGTVDRLALVKAQNEYVSQAVGLIQQQISLKRFEILIEELSGGIFKRFGVDIQ